MDQFYISLSLLTAFIYRFVVNSIGLHILGDFSWKHEAPSHWKSDHILPHAPCGREDERERATKGAMRK